ncbi:lysylphosphatidylglycerol synthase transmembrane domain-containing protein [Halomontanus rarus]|uniref:lysylphosphatidylglycerol synthase transmembrane domain-containing protein n=1 Tax=Halomontanus rarus TaxID=3034020 RepID=UPI0023E76D7B|nr:lysylphosphatidylglycerol synthase transmembrane domain-containing protein [Halovivax sp. TS33]
MNEYISLQRIAASERVRTLVRVVVSAVFLTFIVTTVGVETVLGNVSNVQPIVVVVAIGLSVCNVALSAYKWQLLLRIKGVRIRFSTLLRYYYVGQFFNAFLPTMIGGDGVRAYYLHEEHEAGPDAVSSVVVERLTGLVSVLAIGGLATLLVVDRVPPVVAGSVLLVCVPGTAVLLGLLFTAGGRGLLERTLFGIEWFGVGDRLTSTYDAVHEYRGSPRALVPVILVSLLFRFVLVCNNYVVATGLGMDVPFVYFLVFVPLVEILLFIPVSIQGFGVRETSYVYLFGTVGASAGLALSLGIVMQLVLGVFNNLVGGFVYLFGVDRSR